MSAHSKECACVALIERDLAIAQANEARWSVTKLAERANLAERRLRTTQALLRKALGTLRDVSSAGVSRKLDEIEREMEET